MLHTGKAFVTIPELGRLETKDGAKIDLGGQKREMLNGDNGTPGFRNERANPTLECSIYHNANTSLTTINGLENTSATVETDTGVTYLFTGLTLLEPAQLNAKEGTVELKFGARTAEEV